MINMLQMIEHMAIDRMTILRNAIEFKLTNPDLRMTSLRECPSLLERRFADLDHGLEHSGFAPGGGDA